MTLFIAALPKTLPKPLINSAAPAERKLRENCRITVPEMAQKKKPQSDIALRLFVRTILVA
jgi:hypothetical protein